MARFSSVDDYIEKAPEYSRKHLEEMRELCLGSIKDVEEGISWNTPFYRHKGQIGGFDAFKNHISFGPWYVEALNEVRDELEERGYTVLKNTVQIRYDQKIPRRQIKSMLKTCKQINEAR